VSDRRRKRTRWQLIVICRCENCRRERPITGYELFETERAAENEANEVLAIRGDQVEAFIVEVAE